MTDGAARRFRFAPILAATVLTALLLWLFGSVAHVLLLLFIAILISLYLGAVTRFLAVRARLPRRLAFAGAVALTVAGVAGLFWLLVPPVLEQTRALIKVLPTYIENWELTLDRFMVRYPALQDLWTPGQHRVLRAVYDQLSGQVENVVPRVLSLVEGAISVFSVVVMSIYLALDPGLYREWLIALFPPIHRDLVRDVLTDLADQLRRYIVGQLTNMAILAVLTAIGLKLLDVPYWLTFGVFTGLVAIVPFFGTLLSTTLPALFVLGGPNGGTRALLVILLGVVIHLLEGNIVSPMVMANALELPPVLTIVAVLIVGKLLGPMGLLVALPVLATVMVIVRRILINRVYEGQGFRRTMRDRPLILRVPAPDGGVLVPEAPIDLITIAERAAVRSAS